jgi:hypothetical protein
MPLGFERLNERTQRPNPLINFIRTLPGSTSATAEGVLNRVAAICYPFMKKHMILVQALEEFPYNNEFVGRNFNAGEVIQLVLRNKQGQWLPERWVMMVMVHELAHCKQMNHSKAFWKVRDDYAKDMKDLWMKGYTGEGVWGRGRSLHTGGMFSGSVAAEDVPEHLCGGTYKTRRGKRKRGKAKEELSYAEKKQRRILKKFGTGGQALGADDDTKIKLEGGVSKKVRPRVAGSARGRELRAAAALARFETPKKQAEVKEEELESESDSEDEYEAADVGEGATDVDGKKMLDNKGRALVKICEDEDARDGNARREMEEMQEVEVDHEKRPNKASVKLKEPVSPRSNAAPSRSTPSGKPIHLDEIYKRRPEPTAQNALPTSAQAAPKSRLVCGVCSLSNERGSITCAACSNVINLTLDSDHWHCISLTCKDSQYNNSGDAGYCGVCGVSRRDLQDQK